MTTEEKVENLTEKYSDLHTVVNVLATNVNNLTSELRDFKQEMRQQNEMRADEVKEIRNSIDGMNKHVRNLSYTSIAAIAAMVITVLLNLPKG